MITIETCLVIGASRGIGKAIAFRLLDEGYRVIGTSRTEEGLDRFASAAVGLAGEALPMSLDIRDDLSVERFRDAVTEATDRVNVLVCNAGMMIAADGVPDQEVADWNAVLEVNLTGTFRVIKALWPLLSRTDQARVITVSGGLGNVADGMEGGGCVAYRVSKCGIAALTMTVAEEGREAGILACGYDPEWVRTDLGGDDAPKDPEVCGTEMAALVTRMRSEELTGVLVRAGKVVPW